MSQQTVKRQKVADTSGDVLTAQVAKLRNLFPECVVEGEKADSIANSKGSRALHQPDLGAARAAHH
jgi:hypothetical protein